MAIATFLLFKIDTSHKVYKYDYIIQFQAEKILYSKEKICVFYPITFLPQKGCHSHFYHLQDAKYMVRGDRIQTKALLLVYSFSKLKLVVTN